MYFQAGHEGPNQVQIHTAHFLCVFTYGILKLTYITYWQTGFGHLRNPWYCHFYSSQQAPKSYTNILLNQSGPTWGEQFKLVTNLFLTVFYFTDLQILQWNDTSRFLVLYKWKQSKHEFRYLLLILHKPALNI